jgi:hypothetical protein
MLVHGRKSDFSEISSNQAEIIDRVGAQAFGALVASDRPQDVGIWAFGLLRRNLVKCP